MSKTNKKTGCLVIQIAHPKGRMEGCYGCCGPFGHIDEEKKQLK